MTSAVVCEVEVFQDMTVFEVSQRASALLQRRLGVTEDEVDILVSVDGIVVDGEVRLRDLGLGYGGSAGCALVSAAAAQVARRKAKMARVLASVEEFFPAVPTHLPFDLFGEELAMRAARGLRTGRTIDGRLKFLWRSGVVTTSAEDLLTLSVGTTRVFFPDPGQVSRIKFGTVEEVASG